MGKGPYVEQLVANPRPHEAFFPSAPPGRISLALSEQAQLDNLMQHIHGRAIQVGADLVSVEIQDYTTDHNTLLTKNDKGKQRRRGTASLNQSPGH